MEEADLRPNLLQRQKDPNPVNNRQQCTIGFAHHVTLAKGAVEVVDRIVENTAVDTYIRERVRKSATQEAGRHPVAGRSDVGVIDRAVQQLEFCTNKQIPVEPEMCPGTAAVDRKSIFIAIESGPGALYAYRRAEN